MQQGVVRYDRSFIWHVKWMNGWTTISGSICNDCRDTSNRGGICESSYSTTTTLWTWAPQKQTHLTWTYQMWMIPVISHFYVNYKPIKHTDKKKQTISTSRSNCDLSCLDDWKHRCNHLPQIESLETLLQVGHIHILTPSAPHPFEVRGVALCLSFC